MESGNFGALGFWIFVAAFTVASYWSSARREAEKHETLRRIMEKTGVIDEAKLKELFSPATSQPAEASQPKPGGGYRFLRIVGTIIMFIGAVPAILGTMGLIGRTLWKLSDGAWLPSPPPPGFVVGTLMAAACIVAVGFGVFFSSRFAEPPHGSRTEPPAR